LHLVLPHDAASCKADVLRATASWAETLRYEIEQGASEVSDATCGISP
jgi:hypothetical protein